MTTPSRISLFAASLFAFVTAACNDDDNGDDGNSSNATMPAGDDGSGAADGGGTGTAGDGNGNGDGPVDNVAACEDLLASLECGTTDFTQFVMCDVYANTTCDLVDYFTCLDDNFSCQNGALDASKWTTCANLAMCQ